MTKIKKVLAKDWYHKICQLSCRLVFALFILKIYLGFGAFFLFWGHTRFLREFVFGSSYSVRKVVSWGFNATLVICPICYLWLIVSLYYFLKLHSMFWKVLNAKVILIHEDGTTFSIQLFHDMVVYVVSLEFSDSQEFANDALYLTSKMVRILNESCSKYERIRKTLPIFMELGKCYDEYRHKCRGNLSGGL